MGIADTPCSQPKAQPKSAAADRSKAGITKAGVRGRGKRRVGRSGRPARKTAEELDSEMADYFESANANNENANDGAPAATNGDAPMDDEILVRILRLAVDSHFLTGFFSKFPIFLGRGLDALQQDGCTMLMNMWFASEGFGREQDVLCRLIPHSGPQWPSFGNG